MVMVNHKWHDEDLHVDLGLVDQRGRKVGILVNTAEYDIEVYDLKRHTGSICTVPDTKTGHYFVKHGHAARDGKTFGGASFQVATQSLEETNRAFDIKLTKAHDRARRKFQQVGPVITEVNASGSHAAKRRNQLATLKDQRKVEATVWLCPDMEFGCTHKVRIPGTEVRVCGRPAECPYHVCSLRGKATVSWSERGES
jgi:hypothetical protein